MKPQLALNKLNKAGINIVEYKRPPFEATNLNFFIRNLNDKFYTKINNEVIKDIQVSTSKKHGQATVSLKEEARTAKTIRTLYSSYSDEERAIDEFKNQYSYSDFFNLALPEEIEDEVEVNYKILSIDNPYYNVEITAKIPESETNLLIGMDEKSNFICGLPKRANSVKEAHEILRPPEVPKGSPRQGEFFFVPLTLEEEQQVFKLEPEIISRVELIDRADNEKDHYAFYQIRVNTNKSKIRRLHWGFNYDSGDRQIVRGKIYQDNNRSHDPLYLNTWHWCVPNLEIPVPQEMANAGWD